VRQGCRGSTIIRSPMDRFLTLGPMAATVPAASWPGDV
jgi:hypothetical protein